MAPPKRSVGLYVVDAIFFGACVEVFAFLFLCCFSSSWFRESGGFSEICQNFFSRGSAFFSSDVNFSRVEEPVSTDDMRRFLNCKNCELEVLN